MTYEHQRSSLRSSLTSMKFFPHETCSVVICHAGQDV